MWIFLNDAMFSIVAPTQPKQPGRLLVRARFKGDIERHFSGAKVETTPGRDYRFRALIDRGEVASMLVQAARNLAYGNFKDSVPHTKEHDARYHAYSGVWGVMKNAQTKAAGGREDFDVDREPGLDFEPHDFRLPKVGDPVGDFDFKALDGELAPRGKVKLSKQPPAKARLRK